MGKAEIVGPVVERELRGRPDWVVNALDNMEARGDLVSKRLIGYRLGPDPLVAFKVRVIDRTRPVRARRVRARWVVSSAVAGTGALAALGYWAYLSTQALLPLLERGGAVALLVLAAWWLLGQTGTCPGLHCPGCKHGR